MFKNLSIAAVLIFGNLANATVETAKVQAPQPHPLPFSEVTKYDRNGVCVRRIEPNAMETCYQRQSNFGPTTVKSNGQLVIPEHPPRFQQYINELSSRDEDVLFFLAGTLDLCKEYKITNYFTRPNSKAFIDGSLTNDLYLLEIEFQIEGSYFPHRMFVLGRIATLQDRTRYLTYDGLADYDNFWATSSGTSKWRNKFGLPFNKETKDLTKFMKRGAGFVAPYTLDYILSQRVININQR